MFYKAVDTTINCLFHKQNGSLRYLTSAFDRPAFQSLLEKVKEKQVELLLVKDLSRLGRNYIEVVEYVEKILPFYGVRFLSVSDGLDTKSVIEGSSGLYFAVRNIMNAYYSKELSQKARITRRLKAQEGKALMAVAPFGYQKSAEEKGRLVVDREAASIVCEMFQMFLQGNSAYGIAKQYNEAGILSPRERRIQQQRGEGEKHDRKKVLWGSRGVIDILENPVYLGITVSNRWEKEKIGKRKWKRLEESQWIVVENTHTPIVTREVFAQVQEIFARKREGTGKK